MSAFGDASRDRWQRFEGWIQHLPAVGELRRHRATRLLFAGVIAGALAGIAAGVLDLGIVLASELFLGNAEPAIAAPDPLVRLVVPALTGMFAAGLVAWASRRGRPQGVADVLAHVRDRAQPLSVRDGVASALGAVIAVGGGHSGGREGPIVQLASAVSAKVLRWVGVEPRHERALVAAGGAAGVAASFNTPIAGAFFALEILLGNFAIDAFAPVIAATVTGTVVGQALLGDRIALALPPFRVGHPAEIPLYAILGAVCGVLGAALKRGIELARHWTGDRPLAAPARGLFAGLFVGLVATAGFPEVMGNGYAFMQALAGHADAYGLGFLALLLVAKLASTAATATGRTGAGIFAPSLFIGVVAGTLFGEVGQRILPAIVSTPGAYGMVGMAALAAATLHAPITMTLMLFEMTRNYAIVLPLLAAVAVASVVSRSLARDSIYEAELQHANAGSNTAVPPSSVLSGLRAVNIMRETGHEVLVAGAAPSEIVARFLSRRVDRLYIVDEAGRLQGTIDIHDAKGLLAHPDEVASPPAVRRISTLGPDQPLDEVIGFFFTSNTDELPVCDAAGHLLGTVIERDVVAAYNREVLRNAVPLARVEHADESGHHTDFLELPPGEVMAAVPVASWMVGRALRELALPGTFGCTVLAVRAPAGDDGVSRRRPALPDTVVDVGDDLLLIGPEAGVRALQSGQAPPAT